MEITKELKTLFWISQWMSVLVLKLAKIKLVLTYMKCKKYEKRTYVHKIIILFESYDSVQFMPKMWLLHSAALY